MLRRLLAKPLTIDQTEALIAKEVNFLLQVSKPIKIYLFGSASRGEMTDMSDLDFVAIYTDDAPLQKIKQCYFGQRRDAECSVDMIFYRESDFQQRAEIGGVPMVCVQNGRIVYHEGTAV